MRPNILYLHSHDTGRYVQPYGHNIPTPHIQALAEEGVLFRQAFSAAPTCSPSRAALLTGQCAHSSGMLGLAHRGWSLNDYSQHLVHTLRGVGYRSTLVGVQHLAQDASVIGYDEALHVGKPTAEHVVPAARAFLQRPPTQPFFLSVGFAETHREYPTAAPEEGRYLRPPVPLPDTPQTRADMADYCASARLLDEGVGAVLGALDDAGLSDTTLVICTTDHGIAFPGNKCTLTDRGTGVMLILRGPGGWFGGRVSDALVSHVDLFPTLCDLLSIAPPPWLQGTSLMPLLRDGRRKVRDEVYSEVTYHAAYEPQRAVRTRQTKYIRRYDGRKTPVLPNCDDSPSKDLLLAHGWRQRPVPTEELYDLYYDPCEAHNLAGDPEYADMLDEMRDRLDRWMHATDDPLLAGHVRAPHGARANDPDGLSPQEPTLACG